MGYSGRYHAASLAAVFVALAIGILIGVGLADDVVSGASQELEDSLRNDLDEANAEIDDLTAQLELERDFSSAAAPALVEGRLQREQVALVELGEVDSDTTDPATEGVEAAGGKLSSVAILAIPPDVGALAEAAGGRFAKAKAGPDRGTDLGTAIGRQIVGGGPLLDKVREQLFSRFNGSLDDVGRVVLVGRSPGELAADLSGEGRAFETAFLRGIDSRARGTVAVERSDTDPTTLAAFSAAGIPTVDNVEQMPGQVAMVFALLGAEGEFGVKEGATSLLPDLHPAPADRAT
jgi:hypothetical protein